MTRIFCLGDLMVDVVVLLAEPLRTGSDTTADVRWSGGGSAANTACWAAAAGGSAAVVSRIGADTAGRAASAELAAAGVELFAPVDPSLPTGTCVVLVDAGTRERTMIPSSGANGALSAADVEAVPFAAGDHLHVSGYALFGGAHAAALHAVERARSLGVSVSIGAASSAPLQKAGADAFFAVARSATVFANRDEAAVLAGSRTGGTVGTVGETARAIARRAGEAVVTDGARDAVWSDGERVVGVAPAPGVEVVDSTGAGDAFAAGFLVARFGRAAPEVALAYAHGVAAQACRTVGARPVTGRT